MSVDPTANPFSGGSQPDSRGGARSGANPDLGALKSAFAEAMRVSLTGRLSVGEGSPAETLLRTTDEIQRSAADRRNENKPDQRADVSDRQSRSTAERKTLDREEIRDAELRNEYSDRQQRRESLQIDYRDKAHRTPSGDSTDIGPVSRDSASDAAAPSSVLTASNGLPNPTASTTTFGPTNNVSRSSGVPGAALPASSVAPTVSSPQVVATVPWNVGTGGPVVATPPATAGSGMISTSMLDPLSALTIFSISGRFGQVKDSEEKNGLSEKKKAGKNRIEASTAFGTEGAGIVGANRPGGTDSLFEEPVDGTANGPDRPEIAEKERRDVDPFANPDDQADGRSNGRNGGFSGDEPASGANRNGFSPEKFDEAKRTDITELSDEWRRRIEEAVEEVRRRTVVASNAPSDREVAAPATPNSSDSATPSSFSEQLDRVRLVQRVAAACQSAAQRSGTLRIKVHLDDFGSVTVRVSSESGQLAVCFETTSEAAARFLLEDAAALREALARRNIVLQRLDAEVKHADAA